jgi:Pilus assembly protein, PilO
MNELQKQQDTAPQLNSRSTLATPALLPANGSGGVLSKLRNRTSLMVPYARYGAQKIGPIGVIGLSLCIFSLATLFSTNGPLHQQVSSKTIDLESARQIASGANRDELPDMQAASAKKLVNELPSRNDLPQIMGQIVTIAAASGISLERGNYDFSTTDASDVARYSLSLPVRGTYPQVRQFVENTLAAVPVLALEGMRFERNEVAEQSIAADLEFAVFVGGQ